MPDLFTAQYPDYLQPVAKKLAEKYDYSGEIGAGANGQTFLLIDRATQHKYCLKTISSRLTELGDRERVRKTLENEFHILQPLFHRCLPRIYDADLGGKFPYYVCSFHPGETWEDFRLSGKVLRLDESVFIISSLINTIHYLHEHGRTHCDLHQDNILISERVFGEGVMIIDFGSGHRQSGTEEYTIDRGHLGFKNTRAQARHRKPVARALADDDFRAADFRALGRALQTMRPIFFAKSSHEQNIAYSDFCARLQRGDIANAKEAEVAFAKVVDPNFLITQNDPLFISADGQRPSLNLPAVSPVPIGEAVQAVIDTQAFQRLRGIRQLSFCEWQYPGATHNRFEHSLGAFGTAKLAIEQLARQRDFQAAFDATNVRGALLGALLHDVGHYPFAHVIEHYVAARFAGDHETKREIHHYNNSLSLMASSEISNVTERYWGGNIIEEARRVVDGGRGTLSKILDNAIDCDKIDYLKRDSYHCGLTYGQGFDVAEVISSFTCSADAKDIFFDSSKVHAIEGFMILQDQMLSAVYWHPQVRSIFAMFHRFLDGTVGRDANRLIELVAKLKSSANEYDCIRNVFIPELEKKSRNRPGGATKAELEPLIRLHYYPNSGDIYRPIARYSITDTISPLRRTPFTVFQSIFSSTDTIRVTGVPIDWSNVRRLRASFEDALREKGASPGRFEVLVDVPWGKGANRIVDVVDPDTGEINPITRLSHLSASIFESPTAFSAPIRVFVSPRILTSVSQSIGSIRQAAEERFFDTSVSWERAEHA